MAVHQDLKTLCKELDRFHVAAAVGHVANERLLFWNQSFEEVSTLSKEELQLVNLSRILVWEDTTRDLTGDAKQTAGGRFTPCVLRPPEPAFPIVGKSIRRADGYALILLEPDQEAADAEAAAGARLLGREEEAQRARRLIHDEVSPELLAASFGAHSLGEKLKARQAPESGEMSRVVESLDKAVQRLIAVFSTESTAVQA